MEEAGPIDDPFCEAALHPDEAVADFECHLPVNGANCAALLASGFRWTSAAAAAAREHRVSAAAVVEIRKADEHLHRERQELPCRLVEGDPKAPLAQV
jgi:hypothetical protein